MESDGKLRRVIFDIEADSLTPTLIWIIHCLDIDTGEGFTFYPFKENKSFVEFSGTVGQWIGHHILGFDVPAIRDLIPLAYIDTRDCIDTLVIARLCDGKFPGGHSLENYGEHFGYPKVKQDRWDVWDDNFVSRCKTDVQINLKVYNKYKRFIESPLWQEAIQTEQFMVSVCNDLHNNGFYFDVQKARDLHRKIAGEVAELTEALQEAFPPATVVVREFTPRATKFGTISKQSVPKALWERISDYTIGQTYQQTEEVPFNPGSAPQRIDRLWEAGWKPTEKTDGYKEFIKQKGPKDPDRLARYERYGWKTSEENLSTLPEDAPPAAQTLVKWLLLRSRVSKLEEWLENYNEQTGRIHGTFNAIGAWTQRMSHDKPNMGNTPKFNEKRPETTPYSDVMRSCWTAAPKHLLVGVDAESIQLRILAHYIDDPEFTRAMVEGKKEDGTDPHSVNMRALGSPCKSRDDAKTFIYAWVLGAQVPKVAEILRCNRAEAKYSVKTFLDRYSKLQYLKEKVIPTDAAKGYFQGIDGRYVPIYGDDQDSREHFALAGYLQNGETVAMKRATRIWYPRLKQERIDFKLVNFVHDEWQVEVPEDQELALYVARTMADSLRIVGDLYGLKCPLAGSIMNAHGKLAIGNNWMDTH